MKTIVALSILLASPAFALTATYKCSSSAVMHIMDTKYAEPRVDFYPEGMNSTSAAGAKVFSAYFSELETNKLSSANQVAITKNTHLGLAKVYNTVKFDSNVLQAGRTVNVVKSQKVVSTLGKKVLSTDSKSYKCVIQ